MMTSDKVDVKVNSKVATNIATSIKLVRVAARFDFFNKIEGLTIDKITFKKRYTESHLFAQVKEMAGLASTDNMEYAGSLFNNGVLTATVYGYETDTRNETYFTLEGSYKGRPIETQEIRLENFAIKRNHLYNIILHELGGGVNPDDPNNQFGKLKYEIKVADWEEGESLTMDEEMVLKPLYVDFAGELPKAPYVNPYLVNSPATIYTTTKLATEVILSVGTYIEAGSITVKGNLPEGSQFTEISGSTTKDPKTGKITKAICDRLQGVTIESRDALQVIQCYDCPDTFHFIDPPYLNSDCGHYSGMFGEPQLDALLELLVSLKGKWMLTMFPYDKILAYATAHHWTIHRVERRISASKTNRRKQEEWLVTNY